MKNLNQKIIILPMISILIVLAVILVSCRRSQSKFPALFRFIDHLEETHVVMSPMENLKDNFVPVQEDLSGKWLPVAELSNEDLKVWAAPTKHPVLSFNETIQPEGVHLLKDQKEMAFSESGDKENLTWKWVKVNKTRTSQMLPSYNRKLKCSILNPKKTISFYQILPNSEIKVRVGAKKGANLPENPAVALYLNDQFIESQTVKSCEYTTLDFRIRVEQKLYKIELRYLRQKNPGQNPNNIDIHIKNIRISAPHDIILMSIPSKEISSAQKSSYQLSCLSQQLQKDRNKSFTLDFLLSLYRIVSQEHIHDLGITKNPHSIKKKLIFKDYALNSLLAPPESSFIFNLDLPPDPILEFGCGILEKTWDMPNRSVKFQILLEEDGNQHELYSRILDPFLRAEDREVISQKHDLSPFGGKKVKISFLTQAQNPDAGQRGLSFWYDPLLFQKTDSKKQDEINVILISLDTLRADHLGCYGYTRNTSPHIDSLAQDSAVFQNAFSQSPWTLPSHTSMLTALNPYHHQVYLKEEKMHPSIITVADILRVNHYLCGGITAGGYVSEEFGFAKGFDNYRGERYIAYSVDEARQISLHSQEWLEKNKDKKFFLFLHTYQIHDPYFAHENITESYVQGSLIWKKMPLAKFLGNQQEKRKYPFSEKEKENLVGLYDGEIKYTDEVLIAPLIRKLKELDLYDRTMIILTSDHGEEFYDHDSWLHSHTLYDELINVPLIVKFPESKNRGKRIDTIVRSIDIMPTLLEEADIDYSPFEIDGKSLVPIVKGKEKKNRVFISDFTHKGSEELRPAVVATNKDFYKIIVNRRSSPPKISLFNLRNDPLERISLEEAKSKLVRELFNSILEHYQNFKPVQGKSQRAIIDKKLEERLKALGYIH
jgi:arylsulfatase A-like enzyme